MTDQLKKYLFPDHSTRVQTVRLTTAWQTGLAHQSFPDCVVPLLGELVAAAALLASNIKFSGSVILQLQGDGPVALMVVECMADLSIRATATVREGHALPEQATLQSLLNVNGGGRFTVILDPGKDNKDTGMQPYQGVVPLDGDKVSDVLQAYMKNSEQLDTRLWLAADATQSVGLLLQRLPGQHDDTPDGQGDTAEGWNRACHLAATISHHELLTLPSDALIHRLFWQESLLTYEPLPLRWHCPCTRMRVADMLRTLGQSEVDDILQEHGQIDVSCNFCGKPYSFDAVDCARLFIGSAEQVKPESGSIH